jgi:Zn finger protein HypA/HybF involved in hydrogenase expression
MSRSHDEYVFECAGCGHKIATQTLSTICPNCGRTLEIQWQGEPSQEKP